MINSTATSKVGSFVEIQTGFQFRKKIEPDPNGNCQVIQIKDFDEARNLQFGQLSRVSLQSVPEHALVKKGDVLFLARGHKNFAVPIRVDLEKAVAASYFFILKITNEKLTPEFLAWFINSPVAQSFLNSQAKRGTHMPLIPKSAFSELPVPLPSLERQSKIIQLNKLAQEEQVLSEALAAKRSQLFKTATLELLRRSA